MNITTTEIPWPDYAESEEEIDYMYIPSVRMTFIVCYGIVFLIGNISNVAMLVVCIRKRYEAVKLASSSASNYQNQISQAVTNLFVASLALADIILCVFSLTSTPFSFYSLEWPFGEFLCRFMPSTLILAVCVVSFTCTAMAIDRHISIRYPHSSLRLGAVSSLVAVAVVWALSLLACVPIFLSYGVSQEEFPLFLEGEYYPTLINITKCGEHWPSEDFRRAYSMCLLCLQFVVPAALIAFCYIGVFVALQRQRNFRMASQRAAGASLLKREPSSPALASAQRRLWRVTAILVAMVAIYMACWMPINVLLLIADYYPKSLWQTTKWFSPTYFASHLLAMTSTLWNPLLYGWMNERLRLEILQICHRRRNKKGNRPGNGHLDKAAKPPAGEGPRNLVADTGKAKAENYTPPAAPANHVVNGFCENGSIVPASHETPRLESTRRQSSSGIYDGENNSDSLEHTHPKSKGRKDSTNTHVEDDFEYFPLKGVKNETENIGVNIASITTSMYSIDK